jgi:hypothetical protein
MIHHVKTMNINFDLFACMIKFFEINAYIIWNCRFIDIESSYLLCFSREVW